MEETRLVPAAVNRAGVVLAACPFCGLVSELEANKTSGIISLVLFPKGRPGGTVSAWNSVTAIRPLPVPRSAIPTPRELARFRSP
jgi:hypothetical protein